MADLPAPETAPAPITHLGAALGDLGAWIRYFRDAEIPVLARTSATLEEMRAVEDDVDANMLAAAIQDDPLMTLKLMAQVAARRRDGTETESVTTSLVMLGISPFFRAFGLQPTVEQWLQQEPLALEGVQHVLQRAARGAHFALGFAVHRGNPDAEAIHQAALLHDFTEILMWCHAPSLMLQIRDAQRADPTLRSATIQHAVLGIDLNELRLSLMKLWHLPELLIRISDPHHLAQTDVQNVILAVRLARHTMAGWDNAALPDDIDDIARLLNASPRAALAFVHKIDHPL